MENLLLSDKNRIGEANRGFYYAMEGFTFARILLIGATCVGAADAGLQMGVSYISNASPSAIRWLLTRASHSRPPNARPISRLPGC